jgi:hypothetical protein
MPQFDDQPKIWTGDDVFTDEITPEQTTDLAIIDETPKLPTLEEQEDIVNSSDLKDENKTLLGALVELNKTSAILAQIQNDETIEMQNKVIQATCTSFIHNRMMNNITAEQLKNKLLTNLLQNIDVLDLETQSKIYNDLTEVSAIDAQQALAKMSGASGGMSGNGSGGINLTINNATAEGASINNPTLNVGTAGPSITQLKEVTSLNNSVKAWGSAPMPKKVVTDTESVEK